MNQPTNKTEPALSRSEQYLFAWEAGMVKRWHTHPYMIAEQNIGAHTYGVTLMIAMLHPKPSAALLIAALQHDVPEKHTGDVPRWAKDRNQRLAEALALEEASMARVLGLIGEYVLTDTERDWLHAADLIEAWMWLLHNCKAGNSYAAAEAIRAGYAIGDMMKANKMPIELAGFVGVIGSKFNLDIGGILERE